MPIASGESGAATRAQRGEHLRRALRLERETDARRQAGAREGVPQRARLLGHARDVEGVQGRAVLAGERLRVASRDEQAPARYAHALVFPHVRLSRGVHRREPIAAALGLQATVRGSSSRRRLGVRACV